MKLLEHDSATRASSPAVDPLSLLQIVTLVLWSVCVLVGGLGFLLHYARPSAPAEPSTAKPVEARQVAVQIFPETPPSAGPAQPTQTADLAPPPLADLSPTPALPERTPVAIASPAIAFAAPVTGPTRVVDASQAASGAAPPKSRPPASTAAVGHLTFGRGEGDQPAPQYPEEAVRAHQEGSVTIRFSVGEDGRVIAAEVAVPSRYPLLNEEALRTVRHRWRFRSGAARTYDVSIKFQLREE